MIEIMGESIKPNSMHRKTRSNIVPGIKITPLPFTKTTNYRIDKKCRNSYYHNPHFKEREKHYIPE